MHYVKVGDDGVKLEGKQTHQSIPLSATENSIFAVSMLLYIRFRVKRTRQE